VGLIYGAVAGSGRCGKARQLMHEQSDDRHAVAALGV
jgi:hypothetical protein